MLRKDPVKTKELKELMSKFAASSAPDFNDFKSAAMRLAEDGADLEVLDGNYFSNQSLLHHLVLNNNDGMNDKEIAELLKINSDLINIKNEHGCIPLQALLTANPDVTIEQVEKLLGLGSDLNCKDKHETTLLSSACYQGNLVVAQYLAETKRLDIFAKYSGGRTMLHRSVLVSKNADLWKWLLDSGIDINAQDVNGATALHAAALSNNIEAVKWLILNYANLELQQTNGKTALELAEYNHHGEIAKLLKAAKANISPQVLEAKQVDQLSEPVVERTPKSGINTTSRKKNNNNDNSEAVQASVLSNTNDSSIAKSNHGLFPNEKNSTEKKIGDDAKKINIEHKNNDVTGKKEPEKKTSRLYQPVYAAIEAYVNWYNKIGKCYRGTNGGLSFYYHTYTGIARASKLLASLFEIKNDDEAIQKLIENFLNDKKLKVQFKNHSLATFLMDELSTLPDSPWKDAANRFPGYEYKKPNVR